MTVAAPTGSPMPSIMSSFVRPNMSMVIWQGMNSTPRAWAASSSSFGLATPYVTVPYLSDMELGYAAADLVLCRGGAMTLAEVTTVGLPAVYVPLPYGNGEQRRNALPVVQAGGGVLVDDAELSSDWISRTVVELARDRSRLVEMGLAASRFGRRDGDEALRAFVLEAVSDGAGRHRRSA